MDLYFKVQRAREEIDRLNIEVRRVATYIRDEAHYLHNAEKNARSSDPRIAHQIWLYRMVRGRFTSHHKRRLRDIAGLAGFSGSIVPGTSIQDGKGESASVWKLIEPAGEEEGTGDRDDSAGNEEQSKNTPADQEEAEEEEEAEEAEDELIQSIMSLLTISED
jgi:DNA-directed RNA polymerase specialized sigma24 family protein